MFEHNDHVTTKMGKLPPSPCIACSSKNHWDKECPDHEIYKARTAPSKKNGYITERAVDEGDKMYQTAFSILLSQHIAVSQIDLNQVKVGFEVAVLLSEIDIPSVGVGENGHKTGEVYKTTVEEVEDEDVLHARKKPKSEKHLLYHVNDDQQQEKPARTKHPAESSGDYKSQGPSQHVPQTEVENEIHSEKEEAQRNTFTSERKLDADLEMGEPSNFTAEQNFTMLPPPKEVKPIRMSKKHFYPARESSVRVLVLSVKGRVGNQTGGYHFYHINKATAYGSLCISPQSL